jgi:hypothetical protein
MSPAFMAIDCQTATSPQWTSSMSLVIFEEVVKCDRVKVRASTQVLVIKTVHGRLSVV